MKRFCCFFFMLIICFVFVGCGFNRKFENATSEFCDNFFSAEDENFFVTLAVGKREDPYVVDGASDRLVNYAVLTAEKIGNKLLEHKAKYKLVINSKTYSGMFEVNPFDGTFVVDLLNIGASFEINSLEIIADSKSFSFNLENQLKKDDASFVEVQKIAKKEFKKIEKNIIHKNKFKAEVFYRILKKQGYKHLWYISVVCENGANFAIVIEPSTKEIIAKNFK